LCTPRFGLRPMSSDSAPATISDSASPTVQPVLAGTPVDASSTDAATEAAGLVGVVDPCCVIWLEDCAPPIDLLVGGIRTTDALDVGDVVVGLAFLDELKAGVDDGEPDDERGVEADDDTGDDEEDGPEVVHVGALLSGAEEVVDGGVETVDDVAGGDDEAGGDDAGDEDGEELGIGVLDDDVVSQSGRVTNDQVGWNWESSDEPWSVFVASSAARLAACCWLARW
jgi:hypothetical protein